MSEMKHINAEQRRKAILEMVNAEGNIRVTQLAEVFGISDVTIRGDLIDMEQSGLLRRTRGGAVNTKKAYYQISLNDRMRINKDEKIRIAKACAGMIRDGDTVMIDSGTTTHYVARELADRVNLTIVTNAMQIAQEFVCNKLVNLIFLGGNLDPQYQFTFGSDTLMQLQKYRADKMIIAMDGISHEHGVTTYHYQEADVSRQMIERVSEVIAVADYSKIGKEGFYPIAPFSSINTLITNESCAGAQELDRLRQAGIAVHEV